MADIGKINALALASVDKINNVAKANVAKFSGVTKPSGATGEAFKTDDLEIWWDPENGAASSALTFVNTNTTDDYADMTIENMARTDGYNTSDVSGQPMYGDHRILKGTASDFTTLTIGGVSRGVIHLDGTDDSILTRELQAYASQHSWPYPSSGIWNLGTWLDLCASSGPGFTVEFFWRSDGAFNGQGNIMGTYNEAFRFRMVSGQMVGVGMKLGSSSWNTGWYPSTDTWYHMVFTFDPSASSNQMKIYINGALEAQRTGTSSISSGTWIRNTFLIGAYQTGGAEAQHMYVGLFRKYWTPLTAQEVSDNYDADKSKYGLT